MVPPALLTFSRAVLRERFSSVVSKPVYTFAFERALEVSDQLLLKLTTAVSRRAVVCTTPAALPPCISPISPYISPISPLYLRPTSLPATQGE